MRVQLLFFFLIVFSSDAWGQLCDCPASNSCNPCAGGLTRLTLRFNGTTLSPITVYDQGNLVYSGSIRPGDAFFFNGTVVGEKFLGASVDVYVKGVLNASILTSCGFTFPASSFGSFTVVSAISKNGGTVCCLPASIENVPPTISNYPANVTVNLPSSSCSTIATWIPPTATDNCGVASFNSSDSPGDTFAFGQTQVTYTAIDKYENTSTWSFFVTVKDVTPPVIVGDLKDVIVSANAGCKANASWAAPSATDNCTVTMVSSHSPGASFSLGTHKITYTATDGAGNVATRDFNVIVEDKTPPGITACPSNINTSANESCQAVVSWSIPAFNDNCSAILTSTHSPGATFPFGETVVTYKATDPAGNVATCSFKVLVTNDEEPVVTGCPKDITVNASKTGAAIVNWAEPQGDVQCGELNVVKSHTPGSSFFIGTTTVLYEFKGEYGNSSTCAFNITVVDADGLVGVSKVVTPDGDGINDTWQITNIENYRSNNVLIIDRWGNKIYNAASYDNKSIFWNGTNHKGDKVPTGTYFYTIEIRQQDAVVQKKGFLEVIQ